MTSFRPADHAMGLELQMEELREQQQRALVQGRAGDADRLQEEIEALQAELAATAEMLSTDDVDVARPRLHGGPEPSVRGY